MGEMKGNPAKTALTLGVIGTVFPPSMMGLLAIFFAFKWLSANRHANAVNDQKSMAMAGLILGLISFFELQFFVYVFGARFMK